MVGVMTLVSVNSRLRRPRGFTLPELLAVMVVVLVISTIAVVTFARSRQAADDTVASQALLDVELTQRFWLRDYGSYLTNPLDLEEAMGGQYDFTSAASTHDQEVAVHSVDDGASVGLAILSRSGSCLVMRMTSDGEPPVTDTLDGSVHACTGSAALSADGSEPWRR